MLKFIINNFFSDKYSTSFYYDNFSFKDIKYLQKKVLTMSWLDDNKQTIEHLINYHFHNPNLLMQAFTRKSYKEEHHGEEVDDNEVLEFIGDRAFDLVVTKVLTDRFGVSENNPQWIKFKTLYLKRSPKEAIFTEIKKDLVQTKSLAKIVDRLDLSKLLRMGHGDRLQNINNQPSVKEDLFEAFIGALTIDCNYDLTIIEKVIKHLINFDDYFNNYHTQNVDYLSLIKEWQDQHKIILVDFDNWQSEKNGETWNYHNEFTIAIPKIATKIFIISNQKNKEEAKQALAHQIYDWLNDLHLINQAKEIKFDPNKSAISQVNELIQTNYLKNPRITFSSEGATNSSTWTCTLVTNNNQVFIGKGTTKSIAKENAFKAYLQSVCAKK